VANSFAVPTFAASSATTFTNAANLYIAGDVAAGTNVTLTNSYGLWNVGKTRLEGALVIPSTNTAGIQCYNTVDQTTNPAFFETRYDSNILKLGTRTLGTGTATPLFLFSQSSSAGTTYSRLDIQNSAFPFMRQGLFTTASGTTLASFSSAGQTVLSLLNYINTSSSGISVGLSLNPTYNQSATAGATDLLINRTQTAVGSGAQRLIDAQVATVTQFNVTNAGVLTVTGSLNTGAPQSGTAGAWKLGIKVADTATLDVGNYVQIDIGGVAYKVALVA
jgi:hypothetical protein